MTAPWPRMLVDRVPVDLVDQESAMSLIFDALAATGPLAVVSANLDHIHHFACDPTWTDRPPAVSVDGPTSELRWLTLLDGIPLVRRAKVLTGREWPKLSGSDLIDPVLNRANAFGSRVGFLGGSSETHARLIEVIENRYPALEVAGTWAPARCELTSNSGSARLAQEIRRSAVEILVVGLGKPIQENWISRYGADTGAQALLGFGAAMEFLSGQIPRAPQWVANDGLEWAWRLGREPRRLAHRYLIEAPPALLRLERRACAVAAPPRVPVHHTVGRKQFTPSDRHAAVAIVAVTYNNESDIPSFTESLRTATAGLSVRVIVVDNQSSDGTAELLRTLSDITLIETGGNLGYAGGINAALPMVDPCDAVLVLNPDMVVHRDAITWLISTLDDPTVGAAVPQILDEHGATYPSLRREPTVIGAIGDALMGGRLRRRPGWCSETDHSPHSYRRPHDVDWATGAAVLVRASLARQLGGWNEEYFLYSEETDYFRRIRSAGYRVRYEPLSVMTHRGCGSGTSPALKTLNSVNRIRYVERFHGAMYSTLFRGAVVFSEALRSYSSHHRSTLNFVLNRSRWVELPKASKPPVHEKMHGTRSRGAVIVPAYNEEAVIERTLTPLSHAAATGLIELVVVCNGCRDSTADIARSVPGTLVLELDQGSKPAALNAGDAAATLWPRLYLDADIQISARTALTVLDRLADGAVLAARPASTYDFSGSHALVRSYYRARSRASGPRQRTVLWGAGVYGLSAAGHARVGSFRDRTADDLFVDAQFDVKEKVVVDTDPSVVTTPTDAMSLLAILRRSYRGTTEEAHAPSDQGRRVKSTTASTVLHLVRTVRGPRSLVDSVVYAGMACAARWSAHRSHTLIWDRDESSRSVRM